MKYSGNIRADLAYNEDQSSLIRKENAYYCKICNTYVDESGYELNQYNAKDNYDIENKICYDCENNDDILNDYFDLFQILTNILKP